MNASSGVRPNALRADTTGARQLLNKVPEVTIYFWIIKVLCTTVGETASDFLNVNLGFGLTGTSIVMGIVLLVMLVAQFRAKRYIPTIYWLTVVAISIFGTLVTDNLTDGIGVPLEVSTIVFSVALGLTFILWYVNEKTLSIHSIFTARREAFYWLAILFTFALGTAAGDLMAESLGLGYWLTGVIVCVVIASVSVAWRLGLDPIVAFWTAYIMTRPLGASLGDYLSQSPTYGGLGLGATVTSILFLGAILLTIIFLSVTKRDVVAGRATQAPVATHRVPVFGQVALVVGVLVLAGGAGYYWRHAQLQAEAKTTVTSASPLGDVSSFTSIEEDTLRLVSAGDLAGAKARVDDLETAWDNAEARLKPLNTAKWTEVDETIDTVLRQLRAVHQDPAACKAALEASLVALK